MTSALPPTADITDRERDVRYGPTGDITPFVDHRGSASRIKCVNQPLASRAPPERLSSTATLVQFLRL
jgi:hypothetical protein